MSRETNRDLALLALRLCGLSLAFVHGWGKVVSLVSLGAHAPFVSGVAALGFPLPLFFAWAAAAAELGGGLLIAIGLATRLAAAAATFTMAVAAFLRHHLGQQLLAWLGVLDVPAGTLERWHDPELAAVYLAVFLALTLMGGGRLSIERSLRGRTRRIFS